MSRLCTRMLFVFHSCVLVRHQYVTRMSLICTRMSFACHFYVLLRDPYVTRIYSYVIRMSLVCARMSYVCHHLPSVCPYFLVYRLQYEKKIDSFWDSVA